MASVSSDIRRKMGSVPSASLVRAPPPLSFKVTVPVTQQDFSRLRIDAPLQDPAEGARELPRATKAYYEVSLNRIVGTVYSLAVKQAVARLLASVFALFAGNDHFVNCVVVHVLYGGDDTSCSVGGVEQLIQLKPAVFFGGASRDVIDLNVHVGDRCSPCADHMRIETGKWCIIARRALPHARTHHSRLPQLAQQHHRRVCLALAWTVAGNPPLWWVHADRLGASLLLPFLP